MRTFGSWQKGAKRVSMTMTLWVLFNFFCDEHFWCRAWRTLLLYFQRYSWFSILPFKLQTWWCDHLCNLHNTKMSITLKWKKIFQKGKHHSYFFWKGFQISSNYFSFHRHFKHNCLWFASVWHGAGQFPIETDVANFEHQAHVLRNN